MQNSRTRMIRVSAISLLTVSMLIAGCRSHTSLTTHQKSSQMSSDAEKIAFLRRYLTMKSEIEAAEFTVDYEDNSGGWVPGRSDWDIMAVMKMRPRDTGLWSQTFYKISPDEQDLSWGMSLLPPEDRWRVESRPQVFVAGDRTATVAFFEPEGIVFK